MSQQSIVKVDYTPMLDETRKHVTQLGDFIGAQLVSALAKIQDDVEDAERVLPRVVVKADTLERAGDFKKAVSLSLDSADETRKRITAPARDIQTLINSLFKPWTDRMAAVKSAATKLLDDYYAEIARKAAEAQAADAVNVTAAVEPTAVRSAYGVSTSGVRKVSGEIADLRAFLTWAANHAEDEELKGIDVKKSWINRLAIEADADITRETAEGAEHPLTAEEFLAGTGVKIVVQNKAHVV